MILADKTKIYQYIDAVCKKKECWNIVRYLNWHKNATEEEALSWPNSKD
jgi:hypothetical protein